ncbi:hypothetical protein SEA_BRUHMOMENT_64 [Arthrobacter phage BruhMoment]|nr:hypothetical protein SEA_BRUHMOMENT_64 [Arthrobacter phage BruhMoment]
MMHHHPVFLAFPEGIISVDDISTVCPAREDMLRVREDTAPDGLLVTFKSKGTQLFLKGVTQEAFERRLNQL